MSTALLDRLGAQEVVVLVALAVVLIWLAIACFIVGYVAEQKARNGAAWFFIALIYTPIFAMLALIALPPGERLDIEEDDR